MLVIGETGKGGSELYDSETVKYEECWSKKFAPRLVKTIDGKVHIDTPFSRLLGKKAPIMVAGMTPSTVKAGFISTVLSAGYHIELAGGGHHNAAAVGAKVAEIQSQIPAGVGLTLNSLYINLRQFGIQFPSGKRCARKASPLKPFASPRAFQARRKLPRLLLGSVMRVSSMLASSPASSTGLGKLSVSPRRIPTSLLFFNGPAGDLKATILARISTTYGLICQQSNIALVASSGFGWGSGRLFLISHR